MPPTLPDRASIRGDLDDVPRFLGTLAKGEILDLEYLGKVAGGWGACLRSEQGEDALLRTNGDLKIGKVALSLVTNWTPDPHPVQVLRGFVSGWAEGGLFVRLGPGLDGFVARDNSPWLNIPDLAADRPLPITTLVTVKVLLRSSVVCSCLLITSEASFECILFRQ